jgi:serine/threonine protein kinase
VGVPDQIFGVIDDSWDDEDLPIPLDQIDRLALTPAKDERFERRFYSRQFFYLLRPLQVGEHALYQDEEVVPIDLIERKQWTDKVALPGLPGSVFCRRKVPLEPNQGGMSYEDFHHEINSIRNVQSEHLVSYWGSYTHQGWGYVIFYPATEYSLKSFLATTPASIKNMDKRLRRELVMNWIHCLVDSLCYLHMRGLSHGNIRPSTILFTNDDQIAFADFTSFNPELVGRFSDKTSFDKEAYDYAAPEQWFKPSSAAAGSRKNTNHAVSTSPGNYSFSISRGGIDHANNTAPAAPAPTPYLNPQAADIFSLGCVVLELLSFLLKKHGKPFATHRAAKHKSPGRGGAVPDSSFHKNIGQVESWMAQLAKDASKKNDPVLNGVAPMLHIVERMLALHPAERLVAQDVQTRMYQVLTMNSGISEPHCVHQYGGWDIGIGSLRLNPPTGMAKSQNDHSGSSETASIASKRTGSSVQSLKHRRTNSSSSSRIADSIPRSPKVERLEELENQTNNIGGGFQAIKGIRIHKGASAWQNPPYARQSAPATSWHSRSG